MNNLTLPITQEQLKKLNAFLKELNSTQQAWLAGYLWNVSNNLNSENTYLPSNNEINSLTTITIISASQTGNSKKIAEQLFVDIERIGLNVKLIQAGDYKFKQISQEKYLFIITSTHGDGEPPEEALALFKFLFSKKITHLNSLNYSILALGDSSYDFFCKAGKDFDSQLYKLGGKRIMDLMECDLDYQKTADLWRQNVINYLEKNLSSITQSKSQSHQEILVESSIYTKEKPFHAQISVNQKITARQADKDIRHIEIDLGDSQLKYQPGDALGIWFKNMPELINEILSVLQLAQDSPVNYFGKTITLFDALTHHYELTQNTPIIVTKYAKFAGKSKFNQIISNEFDLKEYSKNTPIVDMILQYPAVITAEEFLSCLRPLTPRLYSIASSQEEVDNEAHITVGVVKYLKNGKKRYGGASGYLSFLKENDEVKIFIEPNDRFRLPTSNVPIIMIGCGTGIAPFRAFMQQREADSAKGKNWLFFGNQHFISDFLYQTEWQHYVKTGLLTQIDLAWSRDQGQKIYVQDKIFNKASEIWNWINDGAHIYVCGDALKMAQDVEKTLTNIIMKEGNMNKEEAEDFINNLRVAQRYLKDIY